MDVRHFRSAAEFRRWLEKHHDTAAELWIGFYRRGSGKTGMSYAEAVDQALCFGWIDGVRKRVDDDSYTNRFTRRTSRSVWSLVNMRRVAELRKMGLMAPPGAAVFEARDPKRSGVYSFENRPASLPPELEKMFRKNKAAWTFWEAQPAGYRRTLTWYIVSAVKDETRRARLALLIEQSAQGRRMGQERPAEKAARRGSSRG